MKKTTAILCASLALFAACTKTALPEPPAPEFPVEETTADEELKLNLTITRADGLGGDAPDTKAIKTGWETGDVIMVFFKTDVHKYLELKYDGVNWIDSCKNGLTGDEIANASPRKLRAIHLPHNQFVRPEPGITSYNMLSYYDYFLESGIVDYTYDTARGLTATLRMAAPEYTGIYAGKLIDFQVTGFDPSRTYHLNMKYLRKLFVSGVTHSALELWYGAYDLDRERLIQGRKDGDAMHFTGLLDQSAVGEPVTFDFTILDQKNKIAYTRSVGPKTVNGNLSVNLGDISDATKWKATEYEDMGIDNEYGKRVYWAVYNLGASATSANLYGDYFGYGQVQGYPIQGTFGNYTCEHNFFRAVPADWDGMLDGDNCLKPEFDAAHVALGGAWRTPRFDEMSLLYMSADATAYETTTRIVYNTSSESAGIKFTGAKSGYRDNSIFLPAAGQVNRQTPADQGNDLLYRTSGPWIADSERVPVMWVDMTRPDLNTLSLALFGYGHLEYSGYPIRPVFTLQ